MAEPAPRAQRPDASPREPAAQGEGHALLSRPVQRLHATAELLNRAPHAPAIVQRKTAAKAGMVNGYTAEGEAALYNIAPAVALPDGNLYERTLVGALDTQDAMNEYIAATRPVGAAVRGHKFLDLNEAAPPLPGQKAWNVADPDAREAERADYAAKVTRLFGFDASALKALNYVNLVTWSNQWARNQRATLRNRDDITLIDPFITKLKIPLIGEPGSWIVETNFSEAAMGYITRITMGSAHVTGRITPTPGAFAAVAGQVSGANTAAYSPAHDTGVGADVGTQIGTVNAGATNAQNHPGLDAVAKWGAEGARFEPVRQLGPRLKVDSRFYARRDDGVPIYLTFQQLYANWGDWFGRGYGIDAATVRVQALAHQTGLPGAVDLDHDYDLDKARPASGRRGAVPREVRALRTRMGDIAREKAEYAAAGHTQREIKNHNDGQNATIREIQEELKVYKRMYPGLYPPVALPAAMPAPPGAGAGGAAAGGAGAGGGGGGNNVGGYAVAGLALTAVIGLWYNYYFRAAAAPVG